MLRRWVNQDPLLFGIVCVVVLVHGLGLGFLAWNFPEPVSKSAKDKKLVVKTMKLNPPKKAVAEEKIVAEAPPPPKPPKQTPPPAPPPPAPPKKTAPPKPVKKKTKPKTQPKPKPKEKTKAPQVDDKKKKLLKQAQETLAKIDQRSENINAKPKKTTKVPKRIESLSFVGVKSSEKAESSSQSAYRNELATHLRAQLQLPEMGNVEVKLVVSRDGRVESVVIVASENDRNADYINETLPKLSLPSFGATFNGAKLHTFHITLTNE